MTVKKESKPKGLFKYYSYSIEGKAKRKSCQKKWRGGKLKSCRNVEVMKKKLKSGKKKVDEKCEMALTELRFSRAKIDVKT